MLSEIKQITFEQNIINNPFATTEQTKSVECIFDDIKNTKNNNSKEQLLKVLKEYAKNEKADLSQEASGDDPSGVSCSRSDPFGCAVEQRGGFVDS